MPVEDMPTCEPDSSLEGCFDHSCERTMQQHYQKGPETIRNCLLSHRHEFQIS
jgi:hypothetical protein